MLDDYHRGSGEESLAAVLPQTAEYFQVEVVDAKANYSQQNTLDADTFNPSGEREAFDEKHEAILTFDIQAARAAAVVLCGKAVSTGNPYCVLCIDRTGTAIPEPGIAVIWQPLSAVGRSLPT